MHATAKEGHDEQETTRGASLRELQRFFTEKDADKTFAGLRRLGDDDGTAVWTVLTGKMEVRAAIKARAIERLTEQADQDQFYRTLLVKLEPKEPTREASSLHPAVGQPPVNTPTEIVVEKKKNCSACDRCTIF